MKRTVAAAVSAMAAGTSIWLAPMAASAVPAGAAASRAAGQPGATIRVVPGWTYQGGKLAVIARCSPRTDLRVIRSGMLRRPVILPRRGNLLIKVTSKTTFGKYAISLWCVNRRHVVDAFDLKRVTVYTRLRGWLQPPAPPLPRHFRARVTVRSGPPARPEKHRARGRRHR